MSNEIQERAAGAVVVSRWVMGAIALALVVLSLCAQAWAEAEDAKCEATGGWFCWAEEITFWFVALPAWIIAGLFVLGALLPSGSFRRLVMAFAVGLPVGIVIMYVSVPLSLAVTEDLPTLMLVASIPALAGFYIAGSIAYRLIRQ